MATFVDPFETKAEPAFVDPFAQPKVSFTDPFKKKEPAFVDPFERSTVQKLTDDPNDLSAQAIGLGENVLAIATGTAGSVLGLAAGLGRAAGAAARDDADPLTEFSEGYEKTAGALTYQPRTEAGKGLAGAIAVPFEKAEELGQEMGETARERATKGGSSPEMSGAKGAYVKTVVSGIPYAVASLLGIRGKKGQSPVEAIDVAKELPIPPEQLLAKLNTQLAEQGVKDAATPSLRADQATALLREDMRKVTSESLEKLQTFLTTDLSTVEIPRAGTNPRQNFVNYLVTTEDAKKALLAAQSLNKKPRTQSLEQLKKTALDEGKTIKDLLDQDGPLSAASVMTYKSVLAAAGKNLEALRERAKGGTETEKALFAAQFQETLKLLDQFDGAKSEWGRTGRVLREPVSDEIARANAIKKLNENSYAGLGVNDLLTLTDGMTTGELLNFAQGARKATTTQKFVEAWKAGLLTGLRTHEANLSSNLLAQIGALQEQAVAGVLGKVLPRRITGKEVEMDKVFLRELPVQVAGMVNGTLDGAKMAYEVLRRGETAAEASKALDVTGRYEAIPGKLGEVVRTPYRVLAAEDKLFKEMAKQGHLNSLAMRQVITEGKQGAEFKSRFQDLVENPTPEMLKKADDMAAYLTFNKELGKVGKAVQGAISSHAAFSFLVPFVRTPTNVVKFAGERTPLALFSQNVRNDLAKGGATRDTAIAKMLVGAGYATAAYQLADSGVLTGNGPVDPGQRSVWLQTNQPYSIKVDGKTYPYNRFEPMGTLFGAASDIHAVWQAAGTEEQDKLAAMLAAAVTKNLTNKTMVAGISSAILAQQDPSRYGERFTNQLVGSVVPTIAAEVAQSRDPIYRQIDSTVDAIKARTPGLSDDLYPKRDLYGRPIKRHEGGTQAFNVMPGREQNTDPAYTELSRLKLAITPPERKVGGKELDMSVYDRYAQDAGDLAYQMVSKLVEHPGYQKAPAFLQQDLIRSSFAEARAIAKVYHGIEQQRLNQQVEKIQKGLR